MEHMSMEVALRWNPREGWFKKDVVQPMAAWAEFTPYLASVAMKGPFEQRGGEFADPVREPPTPQPLLCLPMVVGGKMIRALLDSGASDSFVSWDVVRVLGLRQYPLSQRLTVRVANGEALAVTHFVQLSARLGPMPVRLSLRVIKTTIPIVLGYPFLERTQPTIDWKQRVLRIERNGKVFEIKALAIADSYRMTCPVVRVTKMGDGEVEVGKELKEEDEGRESWLICRFS